MRFNLLAVAMVLSVGCATVPASVGAREIALKAPPVRPYQAVVLASPASMRTMLATAEQVLSASGVTSIGLDVEKWRLEGLVRHGGGARDRIVVTIHPASIAVEVHSELDADGGWLRDEGRVCMGYTYAREQLLAQQIVSSVDASPRVLVATVHRLAKD
jgi:hypothetical protein